MTGSPLIFEVLIAFGAFQAFFISAIILTQPKRTTPKNFFAFFLIIEGITLVERLLVEAELIQDFPHLLGVSYPISFLKPPLLFLLAITMINRQFRFRRIHLLHGLAFTLILLMNLPFYFLDADQKLAFVHEFMTKTPSYASFEFWFSFSFFIHIGAYIAAAIYYLGKYRQHVKNNPQVNWYLRVLWLYSATLMSHFIYFIFQPMGWMDFPLFNLISMLLMTFLIQSIAFHFITGSSIFVPGNTPDLNQARELEAGAKAIREKLETEKAFLDDALTLDDFAASVKLPKKQVSELINQSFGSSFKELINQYRVEEAKAIMQREGETKIQLIDVAMDSGFNNKVTFYRTFKRHTGKSPSEYFQELKSES